jgi:type VI secretion system protein ImpK
VSLFDAYMPVLAFAALFRDDPLLRQTPCALVRADVETLLTAADNASSAYRVRQPALTDDARFAVCVFVDEAMLTAAWEGGGQWAGQTLQWQNFAESNGGEVFYQRLQKLLDSTPSSSAAPQPPQLRPLREKRKSNSSRFGAGRKKGRGLHIWLSDSWRILKKEKPALPASTAFLNAEEDGGLGLNADDIKNDVLGLFAACLSLGFSGKYYGDEQREQLHRLILSCLKGNTALRAADAEQLIMPEAYYMPAKATRKTLYSWARFIIWASIPTLAALILYMLYQSILNVHWDNWLQMMKN